MDINTLIHCAAIYHSLQYQADVPGAANVDLDWLEGDGLWQNIIDDGSIKIDTYGRVASVSHIQLMVLRPVALDGKAEEWLEAKEYVKQKAKDVVGTILITGDALGMFTNSQDASYECGYDKMDANLAYCRIDLYLQETPQCGTKMDEEWIINTVSQF